MGMELDQVPFYWQYHKFVTKDSFKLNCLTRITQIYASDIQDTLAKETYQSW
jgi:hypothetical protein